jgi:large subunit ribosomal protein L3
VNQHPGILGTKLGMTQLFRDDGTLVPCTVVRGGCVVVGKRTLERDGYSALVVGLGERKDKHASKALIGSLKKAGQTPKRVIRELRCSAEYAEQVEIGQPLKVEDVFEPGQLVDVQARSKGRGFTGVMRRHNFAGAKSSHGAHETQRHAGSIGMATTPGRVLKGHKMPGQHGNKTVSVLNLRIAKVEPERQLILIEGGVPGPNHGIVKVRGAVKKRGGKPKKKD